MSAITSDYKTQLQEVVSEKIGLEGSLTSRWIYGNLETKQAAINEIFSEMKTRLPVIKDELLKSECSTCLTSTRNVTKLIGYIQSSHLSPLLDKEEKTIFAEDPTFMRRKLDEVLSKTGVPNTVSIKDCTADPGLLAKVSSIWTEWKSFAYSWNVDTMRTLIDFQENKLKEIPGITCLQLQTIPRLDPSITNSSGYLQALERMRENPGVFWKHLFRLFFLPDETFSWLTSNLLSETACSRYCDEKDREMIILLGIWRPFIRHLLASDECDKLFTKTQQTLLQAVVDSNLVACKLQEIFEQNFQQLLWIMQQYKTSDDPFPRGSRKENSHPITVSDGRVIPLLDCLEADIPRMTNEDGSFCLSYIVHYLPEGKEYIPFHCNVASEENTISQILIALASLSAHEKKFDHRLNALIQLFLSQEGYGVRMSDPVFFATKEPKMTTTNRHMEIELHDISPRLIELHMNYKESMIEVENKHSTAAKSLQHVGKIRVSFGYRLVKTLFGKWKIEEFPVKLCEFSLDPKSNTCFTTQPWSTSYAGDLRETVCAKK